MRLYLLGLFALTVATPALAHEPAPRPSPQIDAAKVGALLSNPLIQEGLAAVVDQYANALLQTHVGPVAQLADPSARIRPEDTLADVIARQDPHYADHLHQGAKGAIAATGKAATGVASMTAELQRTTDRLRAVLAQSGLGLDADR
ncbi:hypothetical protein [Sphingomonas echinoides]|uniref:hypothetical protein n=1 Tax=Sphingomonas echinoides TaxID=59803 RepID=UPI0024137836|nr:hypothetical protein [Sphingomonas echinoides]